MEISYILPQRMIEPQINYVDEFQPTNGRQCSKTKKDLNVPFPNQNQSSRNPRKIGSHRDGIIFGGAMPYI
jgi:hypothetical protein